MCVMPDGYLEVRLYDVYRTVQDEICIFLISIKRFSELRVSHISKELIDAI